MHTPAHPLDIDPDYEAAADRLLAALGPQGAALDPELLLDTLIDTFSQQCFAYAHSVQHPPYNIWFSVEYGPAAPDSMYERFDSLNVASSREAALGFALDEVDYARVLPDRVSVSDEHIELLKGHERVVRIAPVRFDTADELGAARAARTMKGLCQYDNLAQAAARLSRIPGLESVTPFLPDRDGVGHGGPLHLTASNLASRLRSILAGLGLPVKQHRALDLTAALFGAPSWQHLIAHESEAHCFLLPVLVRRCDSESSTQYRFYRTPAEAVAGFAREVKSYEPTPPSIQFCGMSSVNGMSPVLSTRTFPPGAHPKYPFLVCGSPMHVDCGESYLKTAQLLLASPHELQAKLETLLGIRESVETRIAQGSARAGVAPGASLALKDLLFTRRAGGILGNLVIERLTAEGCLRERIITPLHKADIIPQRDGTWALMGDYRRKRELSLAEFSRADIRKLAEFTQLQAYVGRL